MSQSAGHRRLASVFPFIATISRFISIQRRRHLRTSIPRRLAAAYAPPPLLRHFFRLLLFSSLLFHT